MLIPEAAAELDLSHRRTRELATEHRLILRRASAKDIERGAPPNALILDGHKVRRLAKQRAKEGR